jgi:hypothetical protein
MTLRIGHYSRRGALVALYVQTGALCYIPNHSFTPH